MPSRLIQQIGLTILILPLRATAGRAIGRSDNDAVADWRRSTPTKLILGVLPYHPLSARDVNVSTRFATISARIDQAAGVCQFRSTDDYYCAVSANALETT
jgi:hypothetical protein